MNRTAKRVFVTVFAVLVAAATPFTASLAAPALEEFNDSLLTDDLDSLLQGLPAEEDAQTPEKAPAMPRPGGPSGEDLGQSARSPLENIEQGMVESSRLIAERDASGRTPEVQSKVIEDLDALIREAEKQSSKSPSSSPSPSPGRQQSQRSQPQPQPGDEAGEGQPDSQNPSQQAGQQSSAQLRSSGGDPAANRPTSELLKEVWGSLPQRMREQMLESSSDEFLPQYREEIEQYFERLAEEPQQ